MSDRWQLCAFETSGTRYTGVPRVMWTFDSPVVKMSLKKPNDDIESRIADTEIDATRNVKPITFRIRPEENEKGMTVNAIYRFMDDELHFCIANNHEIRPATFRTSPDDGLTLLIFRRPVRRGS